MRKPRVRASKRNVADAAWRQEVRALEEFRFGTRGKTRDEIKHELLVAILKPGESRRADLPEDADGQLLAGLEELATSYLGWKTVPHASRAAARSELDRIRELASRWQTLDAAGKRELKGLVANPNDVAQAALWRELLLIRPELAARKPIFEWLRSDAVEWPLVAKAVDRAIAGAGIGGGDYGDNDLHFAVSALIDSYEWYVGRPPVRYSGRGDPAPMYQFAWSYFAEVDPGLSPVTIQNAIDGALKARSRKRRATAEAG